MIKLVLLVALIGLSLTAPVDNEQTNGQVELPCLNKVAGQRLPHPTDSHKFLRCVTADTLWVETCPDGLFYSPKLEICDWSVEPKSSTPSNEVVKHRPVLVKVKPKFNFASRTTTEQSVVEDLSQA